MSKYKQNPLPKIRDLPLALRIQLSSRGGRQRALTVDQHLVLVLHSYRSSKPSASKRLQPTPVYFWRTPEHEWHFKVIKSSVASPRTVTTPPDSTTELNITLSSSVSTAKPSEVDLLSWRDILPARLVIAQRLRLVNRKSMTIVFLRGEEKVGKSTANGDRHLLSRGSKSVPKPAAFKLKRKRYSGSRFC